MLRLLVLLLLLGNAAYFAWAQGHLLQWGVGPPQQAEPQRVAQQVRPESMRLLSADEARRFEATNASGPKPVECLQAGLFDDKQVAALKQALEPLLPTSAWAFESASEPARWLIYMGRYPHIEAVNKKKAELRQIGVSFENVTTPNLEPGLSLGSFASQDAAQLRLNALAQQGVRTARVLEERAAVTGQLLRLAAVDDAVRPKLDDVRAALSGKALRSCR